MKFRGSLRDDADMGEINISPMIDMVFILLIFFIVTTVFVEEPGVDINKTPTASQSQLPKNSVLIAITADNKIFYGGSEVGLSGIANVVRKGLDQNADAPIILQVDQNSAAGTVVRATTAAKLAAQAAVGSAAIFLSTEPINQG